MFMYTSREAGLTAPWATIRAAAWVAKLVDARDLKSLAGSFRHAGSSPAPGTIERILPMTVRIVRLGTPRARGEGLRLGTVRRLPRGVRKMDYAKRDYFDLWLPELAPSAALVRAGPANWAAFEKRYRREMAAPAAKRLLALLAKLSQQAEFPVGCYCEDERRCHRSVLKKLLKELGANIR